MIKIEELAFKVDTSVYTINSWYRWKKYNPDHELASLLPDFVQEGNRQTRYWDEDAVEALKRFKSSVIHGRNGILSKYKEDKDGKKKD